MKMKSGKGCGPKDKAGKGKMADKKKAKGKAKTAFNFSKDTPV